MAASDSSLHPPREKSALDKFLSLFSKVEAGEGGNVVLLFVAAFILMGLYYVLKPVREALILSQAGAVMKSYASAAQALLFVFVVPIYGAFAARVNRVWLISGMTLFFISNLVLFILAGGAGMQIGVAYYIWLGVFSFMVVSQFWAFANDVYTEEQGKRLFPVVGIGSTLGGVGRGVDCRRCIRNHRSVFADDRGGRAARSGHRADCRHQPPHDYGKQGRIEEGG